MENPIPNSNNVAFKWSVIYVVIGIVITFAFQFLNVDPNSPAKYVGYVPFIIFLFIVQKEYKDKLGGYLSYGQGVGAGFKYALFGGIMMGVFVFIYLTWINPHMLDQAMASQRDKLEAQGLTDEQIDMSLGIATKYGALFGFIGSILMDAFFGIILALIGAAIFKNERPMFSSNDYNEPEQS
jgi:hypothetical protein